MIDIPEATLDSLRGRAKQRVREHCISIGCTPQDLSYGKVCELTIESVLDTVGRRQAEIDVLIGKIRRLPANLLGGEGEEAYFLAHKAADEIEHLRF